MSLTIWVKLGRSSLDGGMTSALYVWGKGRTGRRDRSRRPGNACPVGATTVPEEDSGATSRLVTGLSIAPGVMGMPLLVYVAASYVVVLAEQAERRDSCRQEYLFPVGTVGQQVERACPNPEHCSFPVLEH